MKKIIAFAMALLLLIPLAGCENGHYDIETSELPQDTEAAVTHLKDIQTIMETLRDICDISHFGEPNPIREIADGFAFEGYFGADFEHEAALSCDPILTDAFSCGIVKVAPEKAEEYAALVEEKADQAKWVCMIAPEKRVAVNGPYILLVMGSHEECRSITEAFKSLSIE